MANNMMKAYRRKSEVTLDAKDTQVMCNMLQALFVLAAKDVFNAGPKRLKRLTKTAHKKFEEMADNSKRNVHDFKLSTRDYAFRKIFEEYRSVMGEEAAF